MADIVAGEASELVHFVAYIVVQGIEIFSLLIFWNSPTHTSGASSQAKKLNLLAAKLRLDSSLSRWSCFMVKHTDSLHFVNKMNSSTIRTRPYMLSRVIDGETEDQRSSFKVDSRITIYIFFLKIYGTTL